MKFTKMTTAAVALAAVTLGLAACGSDSGSSEGGVTEVSVYYTAPLTQFSLATIAAENDLFPDDIEVTVDGGDSTVGVSLAASGRADFYLSTQPIPEQIAQGGAGIEWVASWQDGLNVLFIARNGVESLEDMEGKSLGIIQPGFTLSLAGETALRDAGLEPGDYTAVTLGTVPSLASAFASGSVDGVVLDRVTATKLLDQVDGAVELYDFYTEDFPWVGSGVTVSTAFAEENPEAVTSFLIGLQRALDLLRDDPEAAAEAVTKVTGLEAGPELDSAVADFLEHSAEELAAVSQAQVEQAMETLRNAGNDWATVDFGLSVLADPTYLEKAQSE